MTYGRWDIEEDQYDDAIQWTIKEVIDALRDIKPKDLKDEQWIDLYHTLTDNWFDDAYAEYLRIEYESGADDDYLREEF